MKFKIQCDYAPPHSGNPWWEDYEKPIKDPKQWGKETIDSFNSTLRPHEKPRIFIQAVITDKEAFAEHQWNKVNLFTIIHAGLVYDKQKCGICGIDGIRHGLQEPKPTAKYKAKVYRRCDTSLAHISKKKESPNE